MSTAQPLPPVDFTSIQANPPVRLELEYEGRLSPLPEADFAVVTNSNAEWSALDHVFLSHSGSRDLDETKWQGRWYGYARNAPQAQEEEDRFDSQWGFYTVVRVPADDGKAYGVLLFKVDPFVHAALGPEGIAKLYSQILQECQPSVMISVGNAFACRASDAPGDVVITNTARVEEAHHDFTSQVPAPDEDLLSAVAEHLMLPYSSFCTWDDLDYVLEEVNLRHEVSHKAEDFVTPATEPEREAGPAVQIRWGVPIRTADTPEELEGLQESLEHAAIDFDGVLLAAACDHHDTDFVVVRAISSPLPAGPARAADLWASMLGETLAFHTSYNGALAAWAVIAGLRW